MQNQHCQTFFVIQSGNDPVTPLLMTVATMSNVAFAFHCSNPNLNDNALIGEVDIATQTFTPYKENWGSMETYKFHGVWVKLIFPWGQYFNVFVKGVLPDGAMNAGPGEVLCDGKGIVDPDACLVILRP